MSRNLLLFVIGLVVAFSLSTCSDSEITTESFAAVPSQTPTSLVTELPPALTERPTATVESTVSSGVRVVQIATQSSIEIIRWSEDGQSIVYATGGEDPGTIGEWWEYTLSTSEQYVIHPLPTPDPAVWAQLEATGVNETALWLEGKLSPSGTYLVYSRLPVGYAYTPAPDEIYIPPYETWIAQFDGSEAVRLCGRCRVVQVVWLNQEAQVIFSCGEEGAGGIRMANADGSRCDIPSFDVLGINGWMALSPDETKLAFPDAIERLQLASLDNGEVQQIARWGYAPMWSLDGNRLYYLSQESFQSATMADVRAYDLNTDTDTVIVSSPIFGPDGTEISIPIWAVISPLGNAAAFQLRSRLWLVTWSR